MAATAMATTISTLAATAMVKAETAESVQVTCACEPPAPAAVPVVASSPALPEPPVEAEPPIQAADPIDAIDIEAEAEDDDGSLHRSLIRRIVRAHVDEVRFCYNQGLQKDPELAGRVEVELVIGSEGKVTRATAKSEMEGEVPDCIAKAVSGWLFPRPTDAAEVTVTYPFVLEPD